MLCPGSARGRHGAAFALRATAGQGGTEGASGTLAVCSRTGVSPVLTGTAEDGRGTACCARVRHGEEDPDRARHAA